MRRTKLKQEKFCHFCGAETEYLLLPISGLGQKSFLSPHSQLCLVDVVVVIISDSVSVLVCQCISVSVWCHDLLNFSLTALLTPHSSIGSTHSGQQLLLQHDMLESSANKLFRLSLLSLFLYGCWKIYLFVRTHGDVNIKKQEAELLSMIESILVDQGVGGLESVEI